MNRLDVYKGIYDTHPKCEDHRVFFAFDDNQFKAGMERYGYKDISEIVNGGMGLYGSREGIRSFLGEYGNKQDRVKNECDPQEVYDYEFYNKECELTVDDSEAISVIVDIYGIETAREVKRRYAFTEI